MSNRRMQLLAVDDADDNVDLVEIWRAIVQKRWTIFLATSVVVLIALAFVLHARPQFTVMGSLYTGDLKPSASAGSDPSDATASSYLSYLSTFQSATDSETQVDLLTSPLLVQQAVLATGLNAVVTGKGSVSPRYWFWHLFDHGNVAAFAPAPAALEALYANFADPSVINRSYKINFGLGGAYIITRNGAAVLNGRLGQPASGGGLNLLLQAAANGYVPAQGSRYQLAVTDPVVTAQTLLGGKLVVTPGGTATMPSDVINIAFVWPNPYQGTKFINQLMTNYISTIVSWNSGAAGSMVDFITSQLTQVRAQMADADEKLANYQQATGILSPTDNAKDVIDQSAQYEAQRRTLEVQVTALQQIWAALRHPEIGINPYLLNQAGDTALSQLAEKLAEDNASLHALQIQFTGNAPEVQSLQVETQQLQSAIHSMVRNELSEAQSNLDTTNTLLAQYQQNMKNMPAQALQVESLTRSSDFLGQLYILLLQKQQEAALSKAAAVSATRILTPAQFPLGASQPKASFILIFAVVIGLLGSIAWVLGRRATSGKFETESEVRRLIRLPVYGMLPRMLPVDARNLLIGNNFGAFAEAMRITRNNLTHAIPGRRAKIVMVTSAAIGDGKSTVAANLAKALADEGRRVVLIDGDLRRGRLHEGLGAAESPGLSDWLIGGTETLTTQTPEGQRFAVVTTGVKPPNPEEVINDPGLLGMLSKLKTAYDFIIFDSAPLPLVADAVTLAKHADLTLSVIQLGASKHREVAMHLDIISPLAKHHGIVINKTPSAGSGYGYGYGEAARPYAPLHRPAASTDASGARKPAARGGLAHLFHFGRRDGAAVAADCNLSQPSDPAAEPHDLVADEAPVHQD